ncbi:3-hydroxyacyl-CoA dehydrogenase family protein [Nocardia cyriacigeorgica]|uniref:3-hydroxybutyryl-CoA dehydrogenase n=1 Tax=Nocardia cyriacigeorgica TaxID=135487 RepID=A0A4U8W0M8_9NOCA|nr:3-hydroxyacyl-CoA dehydrogenase family protein [Nocardia cyriacigeorgica]VFA99401.1 3-hydroxybutyryl-CoA dehydrogenase [Nocardia cyriacigeorgica]
MTSEGPVGVIGAGTMGTGIAQCLAQAGVPVVLVEADPEATARARRELRSALRLSVLLGRGPGAANLDEIAARIQWAERLDAVRSCSFIIESVTERIDLKAEIFAALDRYCGADTVFASGTSAIPIADLAANTSRPDRILGLHFMNPAPLTEVVEVVSTSATSPASLKRALALLDTLGKKGIVVGDGPGFVINRVLMMCIAEAASVLDTGTDPETVDALFEGCLGHRMGPLRTADLIGLDNVLDTLTVLRTTTGDDRYRIPSALARLVDAGHHGRKSGKGFHEYR